MLPNIVSVFPKAFTIYSQIKWKPGFDFLTVDT